MSKERIIKEMARLEFPNMWGVYQGAIVVAVDDGHGDPEPDPVCECPAYLTDLNAVHQVILKLNNAMLTKAINILQGRLESRDCSSINDLMRRFSRADAALWCEAILCAHGLWEEEEGGEG
jgi:hypothetical protein